MGIDPIARAFASSPASGSEEPTARRERPTPRRGEPPLPEVIGGQLNSPERRVVYDSCYTEVKWLSGTSLRFAPLLNRQN
jgi:hypothetical protein